MSTVTTGLRRRQNEITMNRLPKRCDCCNGSGEVSHGNIQTVERGILGLFDQCTNCDGSGLVDVSMRKIKKRKSKVEVL